MVYFILLNEFTYQIYFFFNFDPLLIILIDPLIFMLVIFSSFLPQYYFLIFLLHFMNLLLFITIQYFYLDKFLYLWILPIFSIHFFLVTFSKDIYLFFKEIIIFKLDPLLTILINSFIFMLVIFSSFIPQ